MPTASDTEESLDSLKVVRWRREQLLGAGYGFADAKILARRQDVDLHEATELVEKGCPPEQAREILL